MTAGAGTGAQAYGAAGQRGVRALVLGALLGSAGHTTRGNLGLWLAVTAASTVAAALGFAVLSGAVPAWVATIQAFAPGAILTMLVDTMVPEAVEHAGPLVGLLTVLGSPPPSCSPLPDVGSMGGRRSARGPLTIGLGCEQGGGLMDAKKTFLSWPVVRQLQTGDFWGAAPRSPLRAPGR